MLNSMIVTNHLGESITIILNEIEPVHGLLLKEIEGAGPPGAQINMAEYATDDGSRWVSSRAEARDITFTFLLTMAPDVETARQNTYKYFPLKKRVNVIFITDHRTCEVYGYVKTNTPVIFEKECYTVITITCDDPWMYKVGDDDPHITNFSVVDPLFEFPFSNESTEEKLIQFGSIGIRAERIIKYEGDTDIGMKLIIQCVSPGVGIITIENQTAGGIMVVDTDKIQTITGSRFDVGDQIILSTVDRTRSARLLRAGVYYNVLNIVDRNSQWFGLEKGDNSIFFATSSGNDDYISFIAENRTAYEGI